LAQPSMAERCLTFYCRKHIFTPLATLWIIYND